MAYLIFWYIFFGFIIFSLALRKAAQSYKSKREFWDDFPIFGTFIFCLIVIAIWPAILIACCVIRLFMAWFDYVVWGNRE